MLRRKKCLSRKHQRYGSCGSSKCPEGLYLPTALATAQQKHDLDKFLLQHNLDPNTAQLSYFNGLIDLQFRKQSQTLSFIYPVQRPEAQKIISRIPKHTTRSFRHVSEMEYYLNKLYHPYASVSLSYCTEPSHELNQLYVGEMNVDFDVRGNGIGRHMRATICRFASERGYAVFGSPTETGDGTITEHCGDIEKYNEHCLQHKQRLEEFYLSSGYELNRVYAPQSTGEARRIEDVEWAQKFNESALQILREAERFVRWPEGKIPANWLRNR